MQEKTMKMYGCTIFYSCFMFLGFEWFKSFKLITGDDRKALKKVQKYFYKKYHFIPETKTAPYTPM